MCESLTRRQLLKYGAMVAATFPFAKVGLEGWSLAAEAQTGFAVPMHLELVTVTDTSAILTWFTGDPTQPDEFGRPAPVAAPGRVLLGSQASGTLAEVESHDPTPYHYVELTGLTPGTTYIFVAESNGVPALRTTISPAGAVLSPTDVDTSNGGLFTTLVPPPGAEIGRIAWVNDLHVGESVSGLAYSDDRLPGGGFPPGFAADPDNPYWRFMTEAMTAEAAARGATLLLANGDVTGSADPAQVGNARRLLDGFGTLGRGEQGPDGVRLVAAGSAPTYFVTRGNHDRAHAGPEYADCSPVEGRPELYDCYRDTFAASFVPGTTRFAVSFGTDTHRYRFVGLDSNDIATGAGQMPDEQIDFLAAHLDAGEATIPLFHHPVGDRATVFAVPPVVFGVRPDQASGFRAALADRDNFAGVYNGHTHRNLRTTSTETGDVPYFEGGAVKEYPGGYTIVRLFEGGYMVNFYKSSTPEARAWSERSRGEYLGLYPYYTLGELGDPTGSTRSTPASAVTRASHPRTGPTPAGRPETGPRARAATSRPRAEVASRPA
ncbi:MAG: metallophosphoesterase family protein [Actinobacteria bacterium]|nr:metallophosphoesterase family protein [Actinomycetota bacterium]